jgi:hypothetical protein
MTNLSKLEVPDASICFKTALLEVVLDKGKDRLYDILNEVSGHVLSCEASLVFGGDLGGCPTINELLEKSSGFELATIKEYSRLREFGYSESDFQHIFLKAFLEVCFAIAF